MRYSRIYFMRYSFALRIIQLHKANVSEKVLLNLNKLDFKKHFATTFNKANKVEWQKFSCEDKCLNQDCFFCYNDSTKILAFTVITDLNCSDQFQL